MDVRAEIVKRLKDIGRTRYWLAKESGLRMTTVYDYLSARNDMNGEYIGRLCDVLGLELRPKGKARR